MTRVATAEGSQADISEPDDLALAHRNTAEHLRQKLAGADADQKLFGLTEAAARLQPLGVSCKLANRFDIGGEPGEAVGGPLLTVEDTRHGTTLDRNSRGNAAAGIGKQGFDGSNRLAQSGV